MSRITAPDGEVSTDTVHCLASDGISLSQQQILAIDNTIHILKSKEIAKIFNWTEMNVGFGGYIPDRGTSGPLHEAEIQKGSYTPNYIQKGKF